MASAGTTRIRRKPAPIWVEPEASSTDVATTTTTMPLSAASESFPQVVPMLLQCQGVQRPMYALSVYNGSDKSLPEVKAPVVAPAPAIPPRNPRRKAVPALPAAVAVAVDASEPASLPSPNTAKILKGFGRFVKKAAGLPESKSSLSTTKEKEVMPVYQIPTLPATAEAPILSVDAYTDSWEDLDILVAPISEPPRIQVRAASLDAHEDEDRFDIDARLLQFITSHPPTRPSLTRPLSSGSYTSSLLSMTENTSASSSSVPTSPRSISPSSPTLIPSAVIFDGCFGAEDDLDDDAFESWFSCENEKPYAMTQSKTTKTTIGTRRPLEEASTGAAVPIYRPLFNPFDLDS